MRRVGVLGWTVSPELAFLFRCLDGEETLGSLSDLAEFSESNKLDWQVFLSLLIRHRVLLPVHKVLKERGLLPLLGETVERRIAERARLQQLVQLKRIAALIQIRAALLENDVEFLCLKGPALSQFLFGDPLAREFGDLDILVRERDLSVAAKILCGIGFTSDDPFDWGGAIINGFELKHLHHAHFSRGDTQVELHWRISRNDAIFDSPMESFFRRKQVVMISGVDYSLFGMPDLMRYLTVHGSSHCWNRIKWLYDVKTLRGTMRDNDCSVGDFDDGSKASRLCEELLDCIWYREPQRANGKKHLYSTSLCLRQITAVEEFPGAVSNMLRRSALLLWLHRGLHAKIAYLASLLIWPPVFEKVRLPKKLELLYFVVGPMYWFVGRLRGMAPRRSA